MISASDTQLLKWPLWEDISLVLQSEAGSAAAWPWWTQFAFEYSAGGMKGLTSQNGPKQPRLLVLPAQCGVVQHSGEADVISAGQTARVTWHRTKANTIPSMLLSTRQCLYCYRCLRFFFWIEFRAFSVFYSFRQNVQFGDSQQNRNKTISRVQSLWFTMKCQPLVLDLWQVTGIHTITIIMRKSSFKETILKGAETHFFFVYSYPILKANTFSSF